MLGRATVHKVFSPGIFINFYKIATNMKLALTKVLFRHNLDCVIHKSSKFKRIINISHKYFLLDLKVLKYLQQTFYKVIRGKIVLK